MNIHEYFEYFARDITRDMHCERLTKSGRAPGAPDLAPPRHPIRNSDAQ
jgi:hypothetical protein